jgi:hypothetical protein
MNTQNEYICELARQMVHPHEGIKQPQLKTFRQWIEFIQSRDAWVNAGIDDKTANLLLTLPFGQVITNTISDYSLFRFGNLGKIIQNKLYSPKDPRVFWIHFLVSQNKINWLQRNNIGVIITTGGDSSFFRRHEDGSFLFNRRDGMYNRLLLNGRDLIHLFKMAYLIKNPQKVDRQDDNFFELLGGDSIEDIFMKLTLK